MISALPFPAQHQGFHSTSLCPSIWNACFSQLPPPWSLPKFPLARRNHSLLWTPLGLTSLSSDASFLPKVICRCICFLSTGLKVPWRFVYLYTHSAYQRIGASLWYSFGRKAESSFQLEDQQGLGRGNLTWPRNKGGISPGGVGRGQGFLGENSRAS